VHICVYVWALGTSVREILLFHYVEMHEDEDECLEESIDRAG